VQAIGASELSLKSLNFRGKHEPTWLELEFQAGDAAVVVNYQTHALKYDELSLSMMGDAPEQWKRRTTHNEIDLWSTGQSIRERLTRLYPELRRGESPACHVDSVLLAKRLVEKVLEHMYRVGVPFKYSEEPMRVSSREYRPKLKVDTR